METKKLSLTNQFVVLHQVNIVNSHMKYMWLWFIISNVFGIYLHIRAHIHITIQASIHVFQDEVIDLVEDARSSLVCADALTAFSTTVPQWKII